MQLRMLSWSLDGNIFPVSLKAPTNGVVTQIPKKDKFKSSLKSIIVNEIYKTLGKVASRR